MSESTASSTPFAGVPSAVYQNFLACLEFIERFLVTQQNRLFIWVPVFLGCGIAAWFQLHNPAQWTGFLLGVSSLAILAWGGMSKYGDFSLLRRSLVFALLLIAIGCCLIWVKSSIVGAIPLQRPVVTQLNAQITERTELPARDMTRLTLNLSKTANLPASVRVNIPQKWDDTAYRTGAHISLRARLMPPAGAALPGAYNFARRAWFDGISATGSALSKPVLLKKSDRRDLVRGAQNKLSRHIQRQLPGSEGAIAATLATGDRGGIAEDDAEAMRRAGLAHLLSISGLHVSAIVGAIYLLAMRLLALSPHLALNYRLPIIAAVLAASGGLAYTLLTGAEVPTIRACVAAILVLIALAIGRDPLSLRMIAAGAIFVLLFWPETLVGPSFQLSFAAVLTIIALHDTDYIKKFFVRRQEPLYKRFLRFVAMLFVTGLAIELTLMPIALYHFHKAGIYGAAANIFAIPLTTFVIMPMEALALLFDTFGAGALFWSVCGYALSLLLDIAHFVESQPGSVARFPSMGVPIFSLFIAGGLWFLLISGRARIFGLIPVVGGIVSLFFLRPPDVLIHSDGRHLALSTEAGELVLLRDRAGEYTVSTLMENAGINGRTIALKDWKNTQCSQDFCTVVLEKPGRNWTILASRSNYMVPERSLAAACKRSDIVVSNRWLPRTCKPKWLKADRNLLSQTGGLSIWLGKEPHLESVASQEGQHGWFRYYEKRKDAP